MGARLCHDRPPSMSMNKTLLQVKSGSKAFQAKSLFDNASFLVGAGEHIGMIGPNGAGKTTLMKIIIGEETFDSGEVIRAAELRVGYLAQHDAALPGETVEQFLERDTTLPMWELRKLSRGLGLSDADFDRPLSTLSGGYRMRVKLLRLLGQQPNLMLLDEPTNYLDLETLLVLERFLQDYDGAFLLISHDREFLRRTTDHIIEVESGDINKFPGNIDDYFEQKALLRDQLEQKAASAQAKRDTVLAFAAKFGAKATKARQVQSRLKSLDRMETIELKALPVTATITIPEPTHTGKMTLRMRDAVLGYPEREVLRHVNLEIMKGDHVGVVGYNGAGKSTLLKTLAQSLALRAGSYELGHQVTIGYYAQHVSEQLNPTATVFEELQAAAHKNIPTQAILDLAGSLLFSGSGVKKKVSVLSGGEKARVCLGRMLLQRSPCLLLDEPTNHLDFYTVEALTQALAAYPGTLIVVSHDQGFIQRITTKILEVRDGSVETYPGTYEDYVWSLQKGVLSGREQSSVREHKKGDQKREVVSDKTAKKGGESRDRKKAIESRLKQIARRLGELEKIQGTCQVELESVSAQLSAAGGSDMKLVNTLSDAQNALEKAEVEWMELAGEKDVLMREESEA